MSFAKSFVSKSSRIKAAFNIFSKQTRAQHTISEEPVVRYCPGGYHPVRIGDTFNNGSYKVVCKLGYGVYSTVWLARDLQTNHHVALKVLAADSFGNGKDTFELDMKHLKVTDLNNPGAAHVLGLLDHFRHHGPNGDHVCLGFKAMGPDLSKYRRLFSSLRLPVPVLKQISKQLLLALAYLHDSCKVIHTDIKPQNILIETSQIREMFKQAPSKVFATHVPPMKPPNDFYMQSEQISSSEEDLSNMKEISVSLTDFGTCE